MPEFALVSPSTESPPRRARGRVQAPIILRKSAYDGWNTDPGLVARALRMFEPPYDVTGNEPRVALDPFSNAHSLFSARIAFTKEDNGLTKPWAELASTAHGPVWLNPPYGVGFLSRVATKVAREADIARALSAPLFRPEFFLLVPDRGKSAWNRNLTERHADAKCVFGAPSFFWLEGKQADNCFPGTICLFYLGHRPKVFCELFRHEGTCYDLAGMRSAGLLYPHERKGRRR